MNNEKYGDKKTIEDIRESDVGVKELVEKLGVLKKKSWQKQMEREMNELKHELNNLRNKIEEEESKQKTDIKINISKTDVILFRYLFENNFLTREQIGKYIYSSLTYANKRLSQLTKAKFIKKRPHPLRGSQSRQTYIMPTKKALSYLKTKKGKKRLKTIKRNDKFKHHFVKPKNYIVRDNISLDQFEHDNQINKLRFEFEDIGASFWISQSIAKRFNLHSKIPDGVFHTSDKETKFVLELEKTLKRQNRYINNRYGILSRYARDDLIDGVLYVVEGDSLYQSIMKKLNPKDIAYSKQAYKKFYVAKLEDILAGDYRFYNRTADKVFNLKEILNS